MTSATAKLVVITGGPGVGKTTLLKELANRQFMTVPEVARKIIKEQVAIKGSALPWADRDAYSALMLKRSIEAEKCARTCDPVNSVVFFDRGIPDILAYVRLSELTPSGILIEAVNKYRYFNTVFLLPPWREIYATDSERRQDYAEAIRTDEWMRRTYLENGYLVREVPRRSPEERANFVLNTLNI